MKNFRLLIVLCLTISASSVFAQWRTNYQGNIYTFDYVGIDVEFPDYDLEVKSTIATVNSSGFLRSKVTNTSNGNAGFIGTYGFGRDNIRLTSLSGYSGNGYIGVYDNSEVRKAEIYVDQYGRGVLSGDIKNFRMQHPTQKNKEIWYASLEGPEAAAYERGTGELVNGEAFIPFSDHFNLVINSDDLTVVLTPQSADTYGLAVVEKTAKGFRVKELKGGSSNFKFDWEAKAVRKGYEDFQVIRDKAASMPEEGLKEKEYNKGEGKRNTTNATFDEATILEDIRLGQNEPNPALDFTIIPLFLNDQAQQVSLDITDANGRIVHTQRINDRGEVNVEVALNNLTSGTYFYNLTIDGVKTTAKSMVIAE